MYSILNVIYGVPITEKISALITEWEGTDKSPWYEDKNGPCGFTSLYHGSTGGLVGYCGVLLGEFDECCEWLRLEDGGIWVKENTRLRLARTVPTEQEKRQANELFAKLHLDIVRLCPELGVYIVFSTS